MISKQVALRQAEFKLSHWKEQYQVQFVSSAALFQSAKSRFPYFWLCSLHGMVHNGDSEYIRESINLLLEQTWCVLIVMGIIDSVLLSVQYLHILLYKNKEFD